MDRALGAIQHWLPRFSVMIIGPGLGRDEMVHETVKQVGRSGGGVQGFGRSSSCCTGMPHHSQL